MNWNLMTSSADEEPITSSSRGDDIDEGKHLKCVLLGDGAVGKTSMVISYTTNGYPMEYVPTAYDNYTVKVRINEDFYKLEICDTAGQDDFDDMRRMCYVDCDVIMACFSVVSPTSLLNVADKWLGEIDSRLRGIPVLLVGTQSDLRDDLDVLVDLATYNQRPVSTEEAMKLVRRNSSIVEYIECSSLTQHNLKEVFDSAIRNALIKKEQGNKRSRKRRKKRKELKMKKMRRKSAVWWRKFFCFASTT